MLTQYKCEGPYSSKDPGAIDFGGCESAVLFARECQESLMGHLEELFMYDGDDGGFAVVAQTNKIWGDTIWSRDMGVLLRELTLWGYTEHAVMTAALLINMSARNEEGYITLTDHLKRGESAPGSEIDGICATTIGMLMLIKRLPKDHPMYQELYNFLTDEKSTVQYLLHIIGSHPFVPGSGEFGSGMDTLDYMVYNSVQNQLTILAMRSMAEWLKENNLDSELETKLRASAQTLEENMLKYMVGEDGAWYWCVESEKCVPNPAVLNSEFNKGFSGINGVLAMAADAYGFELPESKMWEVSRKTIDKLLSFPLRREQYDKYNMWAQFDEHHHGMITGASYSQGYTSQCALLLDDYEMAGRLIDFMAQRTFNELEGFVNERKSPYWFYERMFSQDVLGLEEWEEGCGALNTVNVAEPLKAARIILGLDDINPVEVKLVPRLPEGWNRASARRWPILSNGKVVRAQIDVTAVQGDTIRVKVQADSEIDLKVVNRKTGTSADFKQTKTIDVTL